MTLDIVERNEALARSWIDHFNAGRIDDLLGLYAESCTHTSPKIRALHPDTGGELRGKAALTTWWKEALERLRGLRYEIQRITAGPGGVFVEYTRHAPGEPPMAVAEVFDVEQGAIVASRVYHG